MADSMTEIEDLPEILFPEVLFDNPTFYCNGFRNKILPEFSHPVAS